MKIKKEKIVLIGAGGHALSVLGSIDRRRQKVVGFIDEEKVGEFAGYPIFGCSIESIKDFRKYVYFVAIGDVKARRRWYQIMNLLQVRSTNIIDCSAIVSETASIGNGNFIGKQVIINSGCIIGDNNLINSKALLEHECIVHNHTNISTNAVLNGDVVVQDCAYIGSMSVCNGQKIIGEEAIVGSGAVVTKSVPDGVTVVGVPAKPMKPKGLQAVAEIVSELTDTIEKVGGSI